MPIYPYVCLECNRELEITQKITDDKLTHQMHIKRGGRGEACHGELKRLIGGGTLVTWKGGAPTPKHH
jgi:predicted nucleic acid-binding Zn ribbon protein